MAVDEVSHEALIASEAALREEVRHLRAQLAPPAPASSRRGLLKGIGTAGALGALATAGVAAGAGGSVQPAAALPPSRNAPGPPCFLTVEGRTQGRFPGSRTRAGQSWIEGFAFEIGGIAPTDAATGAATGRRRWQASFRSVAGPATPRLVRAADAGELLQVTVELVEAGANGAEVVTLRARLEDATITSLRTVVDEPGDGRPSRFGAYDEVQVNIRALSIEHPATATTGQATNR